MIFGAHRRFALVFLRMSFIWLAIVICSSGCMSTFQTASMKSNSISVDQGLPVERTRFPSECVEEYEGVVNGKAQKNEKISVFRIPTMNYTSAIFFLDKQHGWVGGKNDLRSTADGGRSWTPLPQPYRNQYYVRYLKFLNLFRGTIVLQNMTTVSAENRTVILDTFDGGVSWQEVYSGDGIYATGFGVIENGGWITGIKYDASGITANNVVLTSDNKSGEWTDVTGTLKRLSGQSNDGTMGLLTYSERTASVVTSFGSIFETKDRGENWILRGEYESSHFRVNAVEKDLNGNAWLIEGVDGREGTYSRTVYFPINGDNSQCIRTHGLPDIFLNGGSTRGDREISVYGKKVTGNSGTMISSGIVIKSDDFGSSWNTIFTGNSSQEFVASATVDNLLFVLDRSGTIVRIEP